MEVDLDPEERTFIAGLSVTPNGCRCPASAAGEIDKVVGGTAVAPVVEEYDTIVENSEVEAEPWGEHGIEIYELDDEQAREAWLVAIERIRQQYNTDHNPAIAAGERVARELGWLEE